MKRLISLLLAMLMVFALCACGASETAETEAAQPAAESEAQAEESAPAEDGKKVLRIGTIETAQSYSPISTGSLHFYLAYEFLCTADSAGNITPWLAESIEWVDELTLKIVLRDGIYFANGEKMTGEDILYSLYYAAYTSGSMLGDKYQCVDFDASYVEEDGLTTIVKTKEPYSELYTWLVKLALTSEKEASALTSDDPNWWDTPISSSAYEIVENVDGSHVTFRLRDDYWDQENVPEWDEITFYFYSNATAMFIAYENGELDMALKVDYKDYDRAIAGDIANADVTTATTCSVNGPQQFILSPYCEYFEDEKVRDAVIHAIDTESIGLVAYGSLYEGGLDSYMAPSFTDAYESQGYIEYDLEYAKQCMAESSYPDGFEITCIAQEADKTALEVVKANLADIGITLNVETYDFATMLSIVLTPGSTDVGFFGGTLHSVDAFESVSAFYEGNGITTSHIIDPEYNELYYSVPTYFEDAEKNEILKEMQRWVYDNKWILPVCLVNYGVVYDNTVLDCSLSNLSVDFVQYSCTPVG